MDSDENRYRYSKVPSAFDIESVKSAFADDQVHVKDELYSTFKPLFYMGMLFGIYIPKSFKKEFVDVVKKIKRVNAAPGSWIIAQVYCTYVAIIAALELVRSCVSYYRDSQAMRDNTEVSAAGKVQLYFYSHYMPVFLSITVLAIVIVFYLASVREQGWRTYFDLMATVHRKGHPEKSRQSLKLLRMRGIVLSLLICYLIAFNITDRVNTFDTRNFKAETFPESQLWPFHQYPTLAVGIRYYIGFMFHGIIYTSLGIFLLVCIAIYSEAKSYNGEFIFTIHETGTLADGAGEFMQFRGRLEEIVILTNYTDNIFAVYLGVCVLAAIIIISQILYNFVWNAHQWKFHSDHIFEAHLKFLSQALMLILVSTVPASYITSVVHETYEVMHRWEHYEFPSRTIAMQFKLMLSRLAGNPWVGLSMMKIFIVDKSTIMKTFGLLLTYLILLFQFRPMPIQCYCPKVYFNVTSDGDHSDSGASDPHH